MKKVFITDLQQFDITLEDRKARPMDVTGIRVLSSEPDVVEVEPTNRPSTFVVSALQPGVSHILITDGHGIGVGPTIKVVVSKAVPIHFEIPK
jgi:hypothetical protein